MFRPYWKPEQPPGRTATRRPAWLVVPCSVMNFCTSAIAVGVTVMVIGIPPVFGTNAHLRASRLIPDYRIRVSPGKLSATAPRVNRELVARQRFRPTLSGGAPGRDPAPARRRG